MESQIAVTSIPRTSSSKGLNVALWIAQILLALVFGMSGSMKLLVPIADLAKNGAWVLAHPDLVHFIGVAEVAGCLGMLLPALTRIKPGLTAWAGMGLLVVMVLASAFHISRGELNHLALTVILGGLAAFVAWGRFRKAPISAR
jgi:putative oxidoreductase